MKNFFRDWNLRRIIYLIGGIWAIVQSVMDKAWFLIPLGLYFVAMAIFKFGCASEIAQFLILLIKNKINIKTTTRCHKNFKKLLIQKSLY